MGAIKKEKQYAKPSMETKSQVFSHAHMKTKD